MPRCTCRSPLGSLLCRVSWLSRSRGRRVVGPVCSIFQIFLRVADENAPAIRSGASERGLARLNDEYDNIRGALQWCRDGSDGAEIGVRLIASLWMYWIRRGLASEGLSWTNSLLGRASSLPGHVTAGALCAAGTLSWIRGENESARERLEQSVMLWRAADDGPRQRCRCSPARRASR